MNVKFKNLVAAVIVASGMSVFSVNGAPADWYQLNMDGVPAIVVEAAKEAKPGIQLQKHRHTWRQDQGVYIVVGYSYGKPWKLNISADGRVISVAAMEKD